ncbi:hypothetical protein V8C86DRAFT_2959352, partial [Haematococcus lacustris]
MGGSVAEHTSLGVYILSISGCILCIAECGKSVLERYQGVKRWWGFTALLAFFAYLYVRPYIRIGLGSASRAYINYSALYIAWLCGALFYHLPSLETMGIDIKADVSMLIVVFLSSLVVLSLLMALHYGAVRLRLLRPQPCAALGTAARTVSGLLLLNSASLALACSMYHSFCGNGLAGEDGRSAATGLRSQLCAKWLHPLTTQQYPTFSAWMLYGEGSPGAAGNSSSHEGVGGGAAVRPPRIISIDFPLDGLGQVAVQAGSVLSPVLTMWITLVVMFIANSVADYAAASTLQAGTMQELRQQGQPQQQQQQEEEEEPASLR